MSTRKPKTRRPRAAKPTFADVDGGIRSAQFNLLLDLVGAVRRAAAKVGGHARAFGDALVAELEQLVRGTMGSGR